MKWTLQYKEAIVTDIFKQYIDSKLAKINRYLHDSAITGEVTLRQVPQNNKKLSNIVQLTIVIGDNFLRAEERAMQMEQAFNAAFEKIERQVKRFKDKQHVDPGKSGREEIIENIKKDTRLARSKKVKIKPMFFSDAVEQMEFLSHDFYMFLNIDTNQVNVVYRREDGGYGLLETEDL